MFRKNFLIATLMIAVFLFSTGVLFLKLGSPSTPAGSFVPSGQAASPDGDGEEKQDAEIKVPVGNPPVRTSYNILLLIPDSSSGNTDVLILFNYAPSTGKISLLTIPRDMRVDMNTSIPKINSAYSIGKSDKVYTVFEKLLGFKPDYYIYVDLKAFRKIVDTLGGVDYNVPVDLNYDDPTQDLSIHFKRGMQHMKGKKDEEFLRYRKTPDEHYTKEMLKYYDGSDTKRTEMQISFLKELIRQKATLSNISKFDDIMEIISANIKTDISPDVMLKLSGGLLGLKNTKMDSFRLSGSSRMINKIFYLIYDGKVVNAATDEELEASDIFSKYFSTFSTPD